MLPIDRKAYTIRSDNYPTIIIINGRYEPKSQLVLCAHELGHALLHSDAVNNFAVTSNNYLLKQVIDYNIAFEGKGYLWNFQM